MPRYLDTLDIWIFGWRKDMIALFFLPEATPRCGTFFFVAELMRKGERYGQRNCGT